MLDNHSIIQEQGRYMKKFLLFLSFLLVSSCVFAENTPRYIYFCTLWPSNEKPEKATRFRAFQIFDEQALSPMYDESLIVRTEHDISLDRALYIAYEDPEVRYLMYIKAEQMIVQSKDGMSHVFKQGDALFFKNTDEVELVSSKGLADTYLKLK